MLRRRGAKEHGYTDQDELGAATRNWTASSDGYDDDDHRGGGTQATVLLERQDREIQYSFDPATEGGYAFDKTGRDILLNEDEDPDRKLDIIRTTGYSNEDFMLFFETHFENQLSDSEKRELQKGIIPPEKVIKVGEAYAATIEDTERLLEDPEIVSYINIKQNGRLLGEANERLLQAKIARTECEQYNILFDQYWSDSMITRWAERNLNQYDPDSLVHKPLVYQAEVINTVQRLYAEDLAEKAAARAEQEAREAAARAEQEAIKRYEREQRNGAATRINAACEKNPEVGLFLHNHGFDLDHLISNGESPSQIADDVEKLHNNGAVKKWIKEYRKENSEIGIFPRVSFRVIKHSDDTIERQISIRSQKATTIIGEVAEPLVDIAGAVKEKASELPNEAKGAVALGAVAAVTLAGQYALNHGNSPLDGKSNKVSIEQVVNYNPKAPEELAASGNTNVVAVDLIGPEKLKIVAEVDDISKKSDDAGPNIVTAGEKPGAALAVNKVDRSALSIMDIAAVNGLTEAEQDYLKHELYRVMLTARHPDAVEQELKDYEPANKGDFHAQLASTLKVKLQSIEAVYNPAQQELISNMLADAVAGITVDADQKAVMASYSQAVEASVAAADQAATAPAPPAAPAPGATPAPANTAPAPAAPNLPPKPKKERFKPPKITKFESLGSKNDIIQYRQRKIFNYLVDKHNYDPFEAVVIIGTMGGETTEYDPTITNGIGAHGMAQWYQGRRDGLQGFAHKRGKSEDDFDTQMAWLVHELNSYKKYCRDAITGPKDFDSYEEVANKLRSEIWQFEDLFEHSGHGNMDGRYRAVEKLARDYVSYKRDKIREAKKTHDQGYDDKIATWEQQVKAAQDAAAAAAAAAAQQPAAPEAAAPAAPAAPANPAPPPNVPAQPAPQAPSAEQVENAEQAALDAAAAAAAEAARHPREDKKPWEKRVVKIGKVTIYNNGDGTDANVDIIRGMRNFGSEGTPGSSWYIERAHGNVIIKHEYSDNLAKMFEAAKKDGIDLSAVSSFRTNSHQVYLWNSMGHDRSVVAPPGHSEHQGAEAIDFSLDGQRISVSNFPYGRIKSRPVSPSNPRWAPGKTYAWLVKNAPHFGFHQYFNEPWHWSPSGH